jgi:uncharacterized membrane protein
MKSKTNLGGALAVTGTALIGVGIVPQLVGLPSKWLSILAVVGFVLSAVGKGVTAYFSADAADVSEVASKVETVAKAVDTINQTGTDSTAKTTAQNTDQK